MAINPLSIAHTDGFSDADTCFVLYMQVYCTHEHTHSGRQCSHTKDTHLGPINLMYLFLDCWSAQYACQFEHTSEVLPVCGVLKGILIHSSFFHLPFRIIYSGKIWALGL